MRPVKGLGLLAALTIALGMVVTEPAFGTAASKVEAATSAQQAIANLAYANVNKGPCDTTSLGDWSFKAADGITSCANKSSWCSIFAAWVWNRSGHVDVTGLGHTPTDIYRYGVQHGTVRESPKGIQPAVGDVVIFSHESSYPFYRDHVAIVVSISSGTWVTTIAGNEGPYPGKVQYRYFDYQTTLSTSPNDGYWAYEYVRPVTH